MKQETHASKYKKDMVEDFARLIREYPIIGAVDMENLPAPQLQIMRSQLKDIVVLKMCKRRLLKIAIEHAKKDKPGIEHIEAHLKGMPALLFTKENPFKLYNLVKKSKSRAPAKAGQLAPYDLVIPAGPTPFAPGPMIGELGMMGIKTTVEGGKISVARDSVVVREKEIIKPKIAEVLARFGIEPMEIGLNIVAVYENGTIYTSDILSIDEEAFARKLQDAHRWALSLAVEAGYYTKEVIELMIPKAFNESKALAKEANIMCDLLAKELVEQAERQALSLTKEANITSEAPQEEQKAKIEEKPAEIPKEHHKPQHKEIPKAEKPAEKIKEIVKEEPAVKIEEPVEEPAKEEAEEVEEFREEEKPEPLEEEAAEEVEEKPIAETQEFVEELKEEIKEKEEEIKEEIEKIEEEVKEELEKPEPVPEEIEKIEEEVEKVEEELEEVEEEKKELPSAAELARKLDRQMPKPKPEYQESENLFEELKKRGTLRGIEKEKKEKPKGKLEPKDIIEQYKKKIEGRK